MARLGNPDRRVTAIDFMEEVGAGLMLNGNQLTILPRSRVCATQSQDGPIPTLVRLGVASLGSPNEAIPRHAYKELEQTRQLLYLWAIAKLADGEYELESTIRIRKRDSAIWENLYAKIGFRIQYGTLARLNLTSHYHQPPIDLSARALAQRAAQVIGDHEEDHDPE